MRTKLALLALIAFFPALASASWHYNENAGFGIYQPEGWSARIEGRSSRLGGPSTDSSQSEIFLGSDWAPRVADPGSLEAHMKNETGHTALSPVTVSGLPGFRGGSDTDGSLYVLRSPGNVIVIGFRLRGSPAQLEEGRTMLGSIEIRVRGVEN